MKFNTFIFDLGGVIISLDESATSKAFAEISNKTEEEILSIYQSSNVFVKYEKGLIDDRKFRMGLKKLLGNKLSNESLDKAWNAMLGTISIERLELLTKLKKNHTVVILSNTNAIHIRAFNIILKEVSGKNDLSYFADYVFFSHDLNRRKPDVDIFEETIKLCGSKPEESLFMDDKLENLLGAQSIGIHTKHITFPDQILELEKYVN